jgi:hypothetical protein
VVDDGDGDDVIVIAIDVLRPGQHASLRAGCVASRGIAGQLLELFIG